MAMEGKDRFLRVYANLPISVRREIVAVVDKEPFSLKVAYREIQGDTKLGQMLLQKLIDLELI